MHITLAHPDHPEVRSLLLEHLAALSGTAPAESRHALDLAGLACADVALFAVWDHTSLAGLGALKRIDHAHAELKSMRTANRYLRRGVASLLLHHLLDHARATGYTQVSLETGAMAYFRPAHALYQRFGFTDCGPFAHYRADPNSRFMTLALTPSAETGAALTPPSTNTMVS